MEEPYNNRWYPIREVSGANSTPDSKNCVRQIKNILKLAAPLIWPNYLLLHIYFSDFEKIKVLEFQSYIKPITERMSSLRAKDCL